MIKSKFTSDPFGEAPEFEEILVPAGQAQGVEIRGIDVPVVSVQAPAEKPSPMVPKWMEPMAKVLVMKPPKPTEKFIRNCRGEVQKNCHGDPVKE